MELVRAASLTGYFAVAEELRLDVVPLLRKSGLVALDDEQPRADASGAFGRPACLKIARERRAA